VADRAIAFTNVFNFRDLGGYRSADGRSVRWRRLFRSDDLSRLRADEADRFVDLGIRTVVDLRRPHEIANDGRILPLDGCAYHHVHLTHPPWPAGRHFADTAERADFLLERYLEIADVAAEGLGCALRLIADPRAAPLVVHCIAGKDRTGVVSALALGLLGVSDHDIADDYTMSELVEPQSWAYIMRNRPDKLAERWRHMTVSPREGMLRFLDQLRARHGSIEAYAASVGVSGAQVDAMRAHLLEDAVDPAVRVGSAPALDVHKGLT
jgi:protein tyrosine/serine phosphatase